MHARKENTFLVFARARTRIIRDLKTEVFRNCQRTANVKKSRDQGLVISFARGLRFTFVRLDHAPEVSDLPQGFFAP